MQHSPKRLSKVDGYFLRLMLWLWLFDMGLLLVVGLWPETVLYAYGLGMIGVLVGTLKFLARLMILAILIVPLGAILYGIVHVCFTVKPRHGQPPNYGVRGLLLLTLVYNVVLYTGLTAISGGNMFVVAPLLWVVSLALTLFLFLLWRYQPGTLSTPWRLVTITLVAVLAGHTLLLFNIPLKLNFARMAPQLEALVPNEPVQEVYQQILPLNSTKPYAITEYRVKPRGGTYFTLAHRYAGFRNNGTMGFVYRPNLEHSPPYRFASRANYQYLSEDWYYFTMGVGFE
ncbi:MAG: hypothetical protein AAFU71_18585 [Cyanobacteria bacterium J06632_22]